MSRGEFVCNSTWHAGPCVMTEKVPACQRIPRQRTPRQRMLMLSVPAFLFGCRYGARFVEEYIDASVGKGTFNVGEFWTDLKWCVCNDLQTVP